MRQEQEPASTEVTELAPGLYRFQLPISMPDLAQIVGVSSAQPH